jgi:hypothetical protein
MEMLNSNWNEERKERLQTLYRDGLSFSLIAAEIGVTRNAAIGKARRMLLPRRIEITQTKPPKPREAAPKRQRATFSIKPPAAAAVPSRDYRCTIYDLKNRSCRFPLWAAGAPHHERLYCGVPGASFSKGRPYCRYHTASCATPRY